MEEEEGFVLEVSKDGTVEGRSLSTNLDAFRMTGRVEQAVFSVDQIYDSDGSTTHWQANVGDNGRTLRDGRWSGALRGEFHARWLRDADAPDGDQAEIQQSIPMGVRETWYTNLTVGTQCLCTCSYGGALSEYTVKIVAISTDAQTSTPIPVGLVKVHYVGWNKSWDEWIARDSPR